MPLHHSASKKAFSENVKAEMHAGKPQKQAVAIAYSVQRKAEHGNFEPTGSDYDPHEEHLGGTCEDHTSPPGQPSQIGTFAGSRHGHERAE